MDTPLHVPPLVPVPEVPGPTIRRHQLRSPLVLLASDMVAITAALLVHGTRSLPEWALIALLPMWLALFGCYRSRLSPSIQVDFFPLVGALATPMLALAVLPGGDARALLHDLPLITLFVILARCVTYTAQRRIRSQNNAAEVTVIVGAGVLGCQVAQALLDHPQYGLLPVGFIDGFADAPGLPLPIVGDIDTFGDTVARLGASRVIVAFGANREAELVEVFRASLTAHVEMHIIPRLFEMGVTPEGPDTDMVWGFPLQHARRAALRTPAWRTKRLMDVIVSLGLLVLASPVLAAAAVAVRLTSPGPVLFRQQRVGQHGDVVEVLKFRSMRVNEEADTRWGQKADERVTRTGKILRLLDVDELPQLINVLRGDMSLVGPRPERPHFVDKFDRQIFRYRDRLRVPVGLTGWAQVHGLRGDTSIDERARFDNYYIEHWSFWFDLVILARTLIHVLGRVAHRLRHSG